MFYDLEDPNLFVSDIYEILEDEGIWHFEQSYMPTMIKHNSYDTICHEHLEYYTLTNVFDLLNNNGFKILDVQLNDINGGSFSVTASKKNSKMISNIKKINSIIEDEKKLKLQNENSYTKFTNHIIKHKKDLIKLIKSIKKDGKKIIGYGASTKGNVILQYCGLSSKELECIADVNKDKFGSYTPGSNIKIISEKEAKKLNPDYMLVLPWHFRKNIIERESFFLKKGGKLIFPLPKIEIFGK